MLVRHGLTPMEALQTATRNPAEFLGRLDSSGTLERGKVADMVLLDANPLSELGNTRRSRAVVANGRLFDRAALDGLLAAASADTSLKEGHTPRSSRRGMPLIKALPVPA